MSQVSDQKAWLKKKEKKKRKSFARLVLNTKQISVFYFLWGVDTHFLFISHGEYTHTLFYLAFNY